MIAHRKAYATAAAAAAAAAMVCNGAAGAHASRSWIGCCMRRDTSRGVCRQRLVLLLKHATLGVVQRGLATLLWYELYELS